jgi:hypothetical protein
MAEILSKSCAVFPAVFAGVTFLMAALAAGRLTLRLSGVKTRSSRLAFPAALALGLNCLGIVVYAAALIDYKILAFAMKTLCCLGALAAVPAILNAIIYTALRVRRSDLLIWSLPALFVLFCLGRGLVLPCGWDEMTYQIAVPVRWLSDNFPSVYQDNPYSGFPSLSNFIYMFLLSFGGLAAPRFFVWALWALSLVFMYNLLRLMLPRGAAAVFACSALFSPAWIMLSGTVYSEPLVVMDFLGVASLFFGAEKIKDKKGLCKQLAVLGFLSGGAAAVKLTGVAAAVFAAVLSAALLRRRKQFFSWAAVLVFAGAAALAAGVFYLRPLLMTGNPFYPFLPEWFGRPAAELAAGAYHSAMGGEKFGLMSAEAFFTIPLMLGFFPEIFDGFFGWQYLTAFMLIGFVTLKDFRVWRSWTAPLMLCAAAAVYAVWFFSSQQCRFLVPALIPFYIAAAAFYRRLSAPAGILAGAAMAVMIFSSVPHPEHFIENRLLCWRTALGVTPAADYVNSSAGEGYLHSADAVLALTQPDSKILLLFEQRTLLFNRKTVVGTPFFQPGMLTPPPETEEGLMEGIARSGADYVLVCGDPRGPDILPSRKEAFEKFRELIAGLAQKGRLTTIWSGSGYSLYRPELSPGASR